ncbi:MAG: hypothetical protein ACLPKB_15020 [Xanthobacteraceae bacterium]
MPKRPKPSSARLLAVSGQWRFDGNGAEYAPDVGSPRPYGICLSPIKFRKGTASVKATISAPGAAARFILGYNATTNSYYTIGIGGHGAAYIVDRFTTLLGWQAIHWIGSLSNLVTGRPYDLSLELAGQRVSLSVDGVEVIDATLPSPLEGDQVGLFAWGDKPIAFKEIRAFSARIESGGFPTACQ